MPFERICLLKGTDIGHWESIYFIKVTYKES